MKRTLLYSLIIFFSITVQGQDKKQPAKEDTVLPIAVYDPRISIKNISFTRRHADNGKGEFLDVMIYLQNKKSQSIDYKIYVLALYDESAMTVYDDPSLPYPTWRKPLPDLEKKKVYFTNLMPKNIEPKVIWGEEQYNKKVKEVEERVLNGYKVELEEPNENEYVAYLLRHPDDALPFTIYGRISPPKDKVLLHNYIAQTEEEKKRQAHDSLEKHNYTIYASKYNTTVTSHHYTEYRPEFYTFNKVVVLIFDPARQKNKLVYRKFLNLNGLKITN